MRHWAPWIEEVVGEMLDDGITHAVSVVLAPHYSALSIAKYGDKIAAGLDLYRGEIAFEHVQSYHDRPLLIEALSARVQDGLSRWPEGQRDRVHVVFSAHSLPVRILAAGDPYDQQLRETARLVAEHAGLDADRWSWSFQSAGRTPEPWLGPQIEDHVAALAADGVTDIISIPVGFVSDHVEILYDIDVKARAVADGLGVRLERPPALNDDPLYIATLVEVIEERAAPWLSARIVSRVVVVGGGIAGLAAALRLERLSPGCRGRARREPAAPRRHHPHRRGERIPDRGRARQLPRTQAPRHRAVQGARPRRAI